jgi:hypothetical protein
MVVMRPRASFAIFLICVSVIFTGFSTNIFSLLFLFPAAPAFLFALPFLFFAAALADFFALPFFFFFEAAGEHRSECFSAGHRAAVGSVFSDFPFHLYNPASPKKRNSFPRFF